MRCLLDSRLSNVSQLAGFSKREDLRYFAREIIRVKYEHVLELAPTATLLNSYQNGKTSWETYSSAYKVLLQKRRVENLSRERFADACLLCSEKVPEHCHRRVAAEYLAAAWGDVEIVHL